MKPNEQTIDPTDEGKSSATDAQKVDSSTTDNTNDEGRKNGVQDRIAQITREKHDALREVAYYKGLVEGGSIKSQQPEPETKKELDPEDFDSDSAYLKAVAKQTRDEIIAENKKQRENDVKLKKSQVVATQYDKGRSTHPDWDEVALSQSHPITQTMFDAAIGDNLSDVLYYLGKNPTVAHKIASLSPTEQIKEIGKVELKVTTTSPKPKPKITDAPAPAKVVKATNSSSSKDENQMTRVELHAKWEKDRLAKLGVK